MPTRAFSVDLYSAALASDGGIASIDLAQIFTNIDIEYTTDTMMAPAAKDPNDADASWDWPRIKSRNWRVTCEGVVDNLGDASLTDLFENVLKRLLETTAGDGKTLEIYGPKSNNHAIHISGPVNVESAELNYPGEAASAQAVFVGSGPWTCEIE